VGVAVTARVGVGMKRTATGVLQLNKNTTRIINMGKRLRMISLIPEHIECVNTFTNPGRHVILCMPET
jgi:hypothetical protein